MPKIQAVKIKCYNTKTQEVYGTLVIPKEDLQRAIELLSPLIPGEFIEDHIKQGIKDISTGEVTQCVSIVTEDFTGLTITPMEGRELNNEV